MLYSKQTDEIERHANHGDRLEHPHCSQTLDLSRNSSKEVQRAFIACRTTKMWLFPVDALETTPSRREGMDAATEKRYRREGVIFIRDIAANLKL